MRKMLFTHIRNIHTCTFSKRHMTEKLYDHTYLDMRPQDMTECHLLDHHTCCLHSRAVDCHMYEFYSVSLNRMWLSRPPTPSTCSKLHLLQLNNIEVVSYWAFFLFKINYVFILKRNPPSSISTKMPEKEMRTLESEKTKMMILRKQKEEDM